MPVLLDTGSTGLNILASAVGSQGVTNVSTLPAETYADGTEYARTLARATVRLGVAGTAETAPISIGLISGVGCRSSEPTCPGRTGAAGLVARGLYGTLGVSPTPGRLSDPLLEVPGGASGFSITYTNPSSGTVTIGLAGQVPAGASVLPLTPLSRAGSPRVTPAWDTASAVTCWTVGDLATSCGRTTFDTGSPSPALDAAAYRGAIAPGGRTFASGLRVSVSAPGHQPFWTFTTGSGPDDRLLAAPPVPGVFATTGSTVYLFASVAYDVVRGRLVVTPRA